MPDNVQTEAQPSMTALVSGIVNDAQQLIRQELALAKSEIREEWSKTKSAAVSFSAAVGVGILGVILLSLMLVYFLNWLSGMPLWGCFAIVGGLCVATAAILFYAGKNTAGQIHVLPQQTMETMRENVQWLKNQT